MSGCVGSGGDGWLERGIPTGHVETHVYFKTYQIVQLMYSLLSGNFLTNTIFLM